MAWNPEPQKSPNATVPNVVHNTGLRSPETEDLAATGGKRNMGKGDLRSRRGKIYRGTHGKTRPGKKNKAKAK